MALTWGKTSYCGILAAEHIQNRPKKDYAANPISIKEYVDTSMGDKNKKAFQAATSGGRLKW